MLNALFHLKWMLIIQVGIKKIKYFKYANCNKNIITNISKIT